MLFRSASATSNTAVPNVQVVKDHFGFVAILHVNTSPSLVTTGHLKFIRETLEIPSAGDSFSLKMTLIEDCVLSKVLLLEVSSAIGLNVSLKNEFSNVIITLPSKDLAWCGHKLCPSHVV